MIWERARPGLGAAVVADVHYEQPGAAEALARGLLEACGEADDRTVPVFFLVGANSSTGDALGPFVGWFLRRKGFCGPWLGELSDPVHAANIRERMNEVRWRAAAYGREPFLIAVDAAVGRAGHITVNRGPLRPGAAMGKSLPAVGQVHIMGGIATAAFGIWFAELDRTVGMAEVIADALIRFWTLRGSPVLPSAAEESCGRPGRAEARPCPKSRGAAGPSRLPAASGVSLTGSG